VLLHGWPGDRTDYRATLPLLDPAITVVVPDLRGFGDSDRHPVDPTAGYSATAQARSIAGLIAELGLSQPVVAGYDIGSRVAQTLATEHPDHVGRLVLSPPLPGIGSRVLNPLARRREPTHAAPGSGASLHASSHRDYWQRRNPGSARTRHRSEIRLAPGSTCRAAKTARRGRRRILGTARRS
jgi:pimeloyl-ACP methyl ester carboxylesterase